MHADRDTAAHPAGDSSVGQRYQSLRGGLSPPPGRACAALSLRRVIERAPKKSSTSLLGAPHRATRALRVFPACSSTGVLLELEALLQQQQPLLLARLEQQMSGAQPDGMQLEEGGTRRSSRWSRRAMARRTWTRGRAFTCTSSPMARRQAIDVQSVSHSETPARMTLRLGELAQRSGGDPDTGPAADFAARCGRLPTARPVALAAAYTLGLQAYSSPCK